MAKPGQKNRNHTDKQPKVKNDNTNTMLELWKTDRPSLGKL